MHPRFSGALAAPSLKHVFWALFIPALLSIGGVIFTITLQFDQRVQAQEISVGRQLTDNLAREFSALIRPDKPLAKNHEVQARIDGVIARFSSFDRLVVVDSRTQVLFDTHPRAHAAPLPKALVEPTGPASSSGADAYTNDGSHRVLASPITDSTGQLSGTVLAFVDAAELADYRLELLAAIALPAAGLTVLSALLCLWPARWLERHIQQQLGPSCESLQGFVLGDSQESNPANDIRKLQPVAPNDPPGIRGPRNNSSSQNGPEAIVAALNDRWRTLDSLQAQIQRQVESRPRP